MIENEEYEIPQAALSHPSTREAIEPTLCMHCGKEVCQIDRIGPESSHPFCKREAQRLLALAAASPTVRRPRRARKSI
jgi:predicted Zn-ribbon and HTH transcriptional regulator